MKASKKLKTQLSGFDEFLTNRKKWSTFKGRYTAYIKTAYTALFSISSVTTQSTCISRSSSVYTQHL